MLNSLQTFLISFLLRQLILVPFHAYNSLSFQSLQSCQEESCHTREVALIKSSQLFFISVTFSQMFHQKFLRRNKKKRQLSYQKWTWIALTVNFNTEECDEKEIFKYLDFVFEYWQIWAQKYVKDIIQVQMLTATKINFKSSLIFIWSL